MSICNMWEYVRARRFCVSIIPAVMFVLIAIPSAGSGLVVEYEIDLHEDSRLPLPATINGEAIGTLTATDLHVIGADPINAFAAGPGDFYSRRWPELPPGGLDPAKYIEFRIQTEPGFSWVPTKVTYSLLTVSGSFIGPRTWQLRAHIDGGSPISIVEHNFFPGVHDPNIQHPFEIADFSMLGSPPFDDIAFRMHGYNSGQNVEGGGFFNRMGVAGTGSNLLIEGVILDDSTDAYLPTGTDVCSVVLGFPGNPGGIDVCFAEVTTAGAFSAEHCAVPVADLETFSSCGIDPSSIDFGLPTDPVLFWDLTFGGEFNAPITLTFEYDDPGLPPFIEQTLLIFHFVGNEWIPIIPIARDLIANTITIQVNTLSPFALGIEDNVLVPTLAPSLLVLAAILFAASGARWAIRRHQRPDWQRR